MRICDVCKDPDPFKRQAAVATIEVHALPGHREELAKPDQYADICLQCLMFKGLNPMREDKDA